MTGRRVSVFTLIAWAMLYGTIADMALAWTFAGPPVLPADAALLAGTALPRHSPARCVTFLLYYGLIRRDRPGPRALIYNVLVVIVAMLLSTLLEELSLVGAGGGGSVLALIGLGHRARRKSSAEQRAVLRDRSGTAAASPAPRFACYSRCGGSPRRTPALVVSPASCERPQRRPRAAQWLPAGLLDNRVP